MNIKALRAACFGVHSAALLSEMAAEAARWPEPYAADAKAARNAEIRALDTAGWKRGAIADRFGLSDKHVWRIIRAQDLTDLNSLTTGRN